MYGIDQLINKTIIQLDWELIRHCLRSELPTRKEMAQDVQDTLWFMFDNGIWEFRKEHWLLNITHPQAVSGTSKVKIEIAFIPVASTGSVQLHKDSEEFEVSSLCPSEKKTLERILHTAINTENYELAKIIHDRITKYRCSVNS